MNNPIFNFDTMKVEKDEKWKSMFNSLSSGEWEEIQLWENGAPNFNNEYNQVQPRLILRHTYKDKARGIVIICAGGAFVFKTDVEAQPVAEYFYKKGLNVAILDYRVNPYTKIDALNDAMRSIRYLRYNAARYNILENKISMLGFSAGGVLAGLAGIKFDYGDKESVDFIERCSSRPDAVIQCYGSMPMAMKANLDDLKFDFEKQKEIAQMDVSKNIRHDSPPFFLFQTAKDDPRGVLRMGIELVEKGICCEVHLFKDGRHGNRLYDGDGVDYNYHTSHWSMLASEWLQDMGF